MRFADLIPAEFPVPDWMGEILDRALAKAAGHKYIRRVPTGNPRRPWKYYYTVAGGHGVGHESEFKVGAAFRLKDHGQEGHFHIREVTPEGDLVIEHDESGHRETIKPAALSGLLHAEHAEAIGAHKRKLRMDLAQVYQTGSAKQRARLQAEAAKYGIGGSAEGQGAKVLQFPKRPAASQAPAPMPAPATTAPAVPVPATAPPEPVEPPKPSPRTTGREGGPAVGSKFQPGRNVTDIAKDVRTDLKAIPGLKAKVQIRRYSGGQSIDVSITGASVSLMNPEWVRWHNDPKTQMQIPPYGMERHTPEGKALLQQVEQILQSYNRDNSDSMSDYYDVEFYGHAKVDYDTEKRETADILAGKPLKVAPAAPEPPPAPAAPAPAPVPSPAPAAAGGLAIHATGRTFPARRELKEAGFTWDADARAWTHGALAPDALAGLVERLGGRGVKFGPPGAAPAAVPTEHPAQVIVEAFHADLEGATSAPAAQVVALAGAQPKNAQRLRESANRAAEEANANLGRDRLTNTRRRVRLAAAAEEMAQSRKQIAETAHAIADAIEAGEAPVLAGVRSLAHVETLERVRRRMKDSGSGKATFPHPVVNASHMKVLLDYVKGRPGTSEATKHWRIHTNPHVMAQSWGAYASRPIDRKHLDTLIASAEAKGLYGGKGYNAEGPRYGQPGYEQHRVKQDATLAVAALRDHMADAKRLESLGITNDGELAEALATYNKLRTEAGKPNPVREAQRSLVGAKIPGYFPTPTGVSNRVMELAGVQPGHSVLEPSAGSGHLADAARAAGGDVTTVERHSRLAEILKLKGYRLGGNDALGHHDKYDRVVMNPPFEAGQDMEHVRHAFEHNLKPGGRLVAVMSESPFFHSGKAAESFRQWFEANGGTSERLPAGSFSQGDVPTGVNTRLVVLNRRQGT